MPDFLRVLLIDSSATLHRCFHGYPPKPSLLPSGHAMETGALCGYLHYVRTLERDFSFDRIVHVVDPEGGSHYRLRLFPEYKAQRAPNDPTLTAQKVLLPEVLAAFGHHVVCKRGIESDDILATLAERHAARGDQVLIATPDKDLLQLVRKGSIAVARRVDRTDGGLGKIHHVYDEEDVVAKLGVRPEQVADFLALTGDTSDNIPGVFKVGEKTAARLLNDYGDLATLMTHAGSIAGKLGEHLRDALPHLPLYRQLTTVLRDLEGIHPMDDDLPLEATTVAMFRRLLDVPAAWPDRLLDSWRPFSAVAPKRPNATAEAIPATPEPPAAEPMHAEPMHAEPMHAEPMHAEPSSPAPALGRRRPAWVG